MNTKKSKENLYKCFDCGHPITKQEIQRRIICPYCGSRIIKKSRPTVIKKVKAR